MVICYSSRKNRIQRRFTLTFYQELLSTEGEEKPSTEAEAESAEKLDEGIIIVFIHVMFGVVFLDSKELEAPKEDDLVREWGNAGLPLGATKLEGVKRHLLR